jgi:hypothetical protein
VAEFDVKTGHDTWLSEASPNAVNPSGRFPAVRAGGSARFRTLLNMPLSASRIGGKTILSAILSAPVHGNWVNQTITVQALAASWNQARANWNNQPGVLGATAVSAATGALTAGQRFEIDVTALVQAIANGQANYGWRITTSQSTDRSTFRGFDSGFAAWTLHVEVSDAPAKPTQLAPAGVISVAKPVLLFDEIDDLAAVNVQVDASASSPFDYDSGWVNVTTPQLDLAAITANQLPASQGNAGTFDTDIAGWLTSNCAIARVTTPVQAGAGALRMTASSAADMYAAASNTLSAMVPVVPGQTYHVEAYSRAATTSRSTRVEIQWYDAAGVSLSVSTGTATANSTGAYGLRELAAVAPAGAAYLRPRLYVIAPASGEIHYWDTVTVNVGTANFGGLADGATTNWRCRVKSTDGSISAWSDWVSITRAVKPVIVMDNPSGTALWDPTPSIAAHLSPAGSADTRWQVIVTAVGDPTDVRYNSGDALDGATLDHQIPLRWNGQRVFVDDGTYRLVVKAWDRSDRVPSPGDPSFVRTITVVTLDADNLLAPPDSLTLSQLTSGYPDIKLHWTRAADPDYGFVVRRDGEFLVFLDVNDYRVAPGVWEWIDESAAPNVAHQYAVRAVVNSGGQRKQTPNSPAMSIFAEVLSVWLRSDLGDIELFGEYPEAKQVTMVQSFDLPYRSEPVDIVTAVGGYQCDSYTGTIDRRTPDLSDVLDQLQRLRHIPTAEIRLIWSTHNVWVNLRGLSVAASKKSIKTNPIYDVSFGFFEIDPRD